MLSPQERAALILQVRAKRDACVLYKPNPIQQEYHNSMARYRLGVGVNRGGKSTIGAYELAAAARRIHPKRSTTVNGSYLLFAPKRKQLTEIWERKLLINSELSNIGEPCPFIPEWEILRTGYTYGAGVPTISDIKLKNGNSIICYPSDTKDVWRKVEGLGMILGVVIDEAVGDATFLTECATRLLDANSNDKVIADCGGGWLCWNGTQNKDNPALDQLVDNITNFPNRFEKFQIFRLTSDDNKTIKISERESIRVLMSDDEYKVRMEGTDSVGNQMRVFSQWKDERHWITDPTRIHIPSNTATFWLGYDPGANLTGMVLACFEQDAPRTMRVVRCWQLARSTIENDVLELRRYLRGRFLEGVIYDQASRKVEKVGDNVAHKLHRVMNTKAYAVTVKRGMTFGISQYKASVPILRQYLDPNPRDQTAKPFLTVNGDPESQCTVLRSQILFQHFTSKAHELKESNISKGNDHCCFPAGTVIRTHNGTCPIQMIKPGMLVWTRDGCHPVDIIVMSNPDAKIGTVTLVDGTVLTGTPDHPVWTEQRGWTRLDNLSISDTVVTCEMNPNAGCAGVATHGAGTQNQSAAVTPITTAGLSRSMASRYACCSTDPCGSSTEGKSQMGITSTTRTRTPRTMTSIIWSAFLAAITYLDICLTALRTRDSSIISGSALPIFDRSPRSGMPRRKDANGIASTPLRHSRVGSQRRSSAATAVSPSCPLPGDRGFAPMHARLAGDKSLGLMTSIRPAPYADWSSEPTSTSSLSLVVQSVARPYVSSGRSAVYAMAVANCHEYFANGVLVSNCDALRYLCSVKPGWTNRGPNPILWEPGEDPEEGNRHDNAGLVLSEEGMRLELAMQAGARMAKKRLTKWRNRARA